MVVAVLYVTQEHLEPGWSNPTPRRRLLQGANKSVRWRVYQALIDHYKLLCPSDYCQFVRKIYRLVPIPHLSSCLQKSIHLFCVPVQVFLLMFLRAKSKYMHATNYCMVYIISFHRLRNYICVTGGVARLTGYQNCEKRSCTENKGRGRL